MQSSNLKAEGRGATDHMALAALADQPPLPLSNVVSIRPAGSARVRAIAPVRRSARAIEPKILSSICDPRRVMFLDIETTGLSRYYDEITLVGWLLNGVYQVYIAGDDPALLLSSLQDAAALVTFNGTLFDLPFLRKSFPRIYLPEVHADLRFLARRTGLTGGQKAIEKELGIQEREGIESLDGAQAVLLWHRYLRGDTCALHQLIAYNRADVVSMQFILDHVVDQLVRDPDFWSSPCRFSSRPFVTTGWATPGNALPDANRLNRPQNTFSALFAGTAAENAVIVGIDLTGSEARPSGWCELHGASAQTNMVATDDELVTRVLEASPALVSIDSPLSIPFGRARVEDDDPMRETFGIMRRCERELKRRGINVYPCLLPSMQGLTRRGMQLASRLRRLGVAVIESYPGSAQDIMGIPRKGAGPQFLKEGLAQFGVTGDFIVEQVSHDELDAITSALVGSFFLAGKYEALSGPSEDALIIPDLQAEKKPVVIGISGGICAGKTTASRALERLGYAYTRFSQIVDDEIERIGQRRNRRTQQSVGLEIHRTKGQRWLCERVLERVGSQPMIVIDGLRFLEDRAFFAERFGANFLHLHITAPQGLRRDRYRAKGGPSFDTAVCQPVEQEVGQLEALAAVKVDNSGTIEALDAIVAEHSQAFLWSATTECRFRSL
jgi:predicted nuclease with RNAse H fold/dephospho-CoA kinase